MSYPFLIGEIIFHETSPVNFNIIFGSDNIIYL